MAKKLALTVVLAMALVALAAANTYRTTTITTTVDEEANPGRQQQCRQQVQGRQFNHCQRYLSQSRSFSGQVDDEIVEMVSENPGRQQEQEHLRQCCQELRNVQDQCQCEAIRHAAKQAQQEQGQGYGYGYGSRQGQQEREEGYGREGQRERGKEYGSRGQSEQVYQRAQQLPRRCNLSEQQCQFRIVFV